MLPVGHSTIILEDICFINFEVNPKFKYLATSQASLDITIPDISIDWQNEASHGHLMPVWHHDKNFQSDSSLDGSAHKAGGEGKSTSHEYGKDMEDEKQDESHFTSTHPNTVNSQNEEKVSNSAPDDKDADKNTDLRETDVKIINDNYKASTKMVVTTGHGDTRQQKTSDAMPPDSEASPLNGVEDNSDQDGHGVQQDNLVRQTTETVGDITHQSVTASSDQGKNSGDGTNDSKSTEKRHDLTYSVRKDDDQHKFTQVPSTKHYGGNLNRKFPTLGSLCSNYLWDAVTTCYDVPYII